MSSAPSPIALPPGFAAALEAAEAAAEQRARRTDPQVTAALDQAATINMFDMAWLDARAPVDAPEAFRSRMVEASEAVDRGRGHWRLELAQRRERLAALRAEPGRLDAVAAAATPMAGDDRAALLRETFAGVPLTPDKLDDETLPALLDVATWLQGLGFDVPGARQVRREGERRTRLAVFAEMRDRFVGRREALDIVNGFIDRPATAPLELLSISGLGGIGKSALLARLMHDRLSSPTRPSPLIVHIDFDRIGVSPLDPAELDAELTRQLALALPDLAPDLDRLRQEVRDARRNDVERSAPQESDRLAHTDLLGEIAYIFGSRGLVGQKLLFVFDTVEELQVQSEHALDALAEWLVALGQRAGFPEIRVIAAGRAPVTFPPGFPVSTAPPLVLDELEADFALDLLRQFDVTGPIASALVRRYGGNPLVLRLIGRLVEQYGDAMFAEDDLVEGIEALNRAVVQGMLYDRILGHLKDERLQSLAYPGLLLRRVTPALIREVIAPVTLEGQLTPGDEDTLFQALRSKVWLVKPGTAADEVEHRSDIRRLMMSMMEMDASRDEQVDAIHRRAISYYETAPGRDRPSAAAEAVYHRFMAADDALVPHLDAATAALASRAIGGSLDEVPVRRRAWLRVALGQSINTQDAPALPDYLWRPYLDQAGPAHIQREEYLGALELIGLRTLPASYAPDWMIAAIDASGQWIEAATLLNTRFMNDKPKRGSLEWFVPAATLSSLLFRGGEIEGAALVARYALDARPEPNPPVLSAALRCGQIAARCQDRLGRTVLGKPLPINFQTSDLLRDETLAFEHLRYLQAAGLVEQQEFRPTQHQFYPSHLWLRHLREQGGKVVAEALAPLAEELENIDARRMSTGRLLAHFSGLFSRAMVDPFLRKAIPPEAKRLIGAVQEHPEFRPAAHFALVELAHVTAHDRRLTASLFPRMVAAIRPWLPIFPQDLLEIVIETPQQVRVAATTLVAFADRCQALAPLMAAVTAFAAEHARGLSPLSARVENALLAGRTRGEVEVARPLRPLSN